ncbi:MAG TPA: PEGA domain-containing protein [Polyangiaceae bacterium]
MPFQRTKARSGRRRLGTPGRGAALALLTCALVSHSLPAWAADTASTAGARNDPQRRALAKAKYQQGVEAYRAERYADAVRLFLEADALEPSAALSYNIARAYEKLADDAQTLRWYRNYLRLNPEAPNAADVQQFVRTLSEALAKKGIQQLSVLSTPSSATVSIDGNPLGVTPLTVELPPGAHSALLTLRGFSDAQVRFTLTVATPIDLRVQLQPAPAQPTSLVAAEPRGRRFGIAPYITLGAGAVLLGTAALFEVGRHSAQSAAKDDATQLDYERDVNAMNSRQTMARVFVGVGAAVTITGAALLVFNTRLTPETRARVSGSPGGGALLLERSF